MPFEGVHSPVGRELQSVEHSIVSFAHRNVYPLSEGIVTLLSVFLRIGYKVHSRKILSTPMQKVENARSFSFDELRTTVKSAETPVLVDFWEPRCTACRATLKTIDDLACRVDEYGVVGTFNVRDNPEAVKSLGIEMVPTLLVFRDGEVESVLQGAETIQDFVERIDEEVFFGAPPTCDR